MKPNDHKAYAEYCQRFNLKPTLSTYPVMYFIDQNGKTITRRMTEVYSELGWKLNPLTNRWSRGAKKKKERIT